jgi:hypothetical protein
LEDGERSVYSRSRELWSSQESLVVPEWFLGAIFTVAIASMLSNSQKDRTVNFLGPIIIGI